MTITDGREETRRPGRPRKYDWPKLLDGNEHVLVRGEHFEHSPVSMQQQVRTAASRLRQSVSVRLLGDRIVINPSRRIPYAGGAPITYPYLEWCKRSLDSRDFVVIRQGEDFKIPPSAMRQLIERWAERNGWAIGGMKVVGEQLGFMAKPEDIDAWRESEEASGESSDSHSDGTVE